MLKAWVLLGLVVFAGLVMFAAKIGAGFLVMLAGLLGMFVLSVRSAGREDDQPRVAGHAGGLHLRRRRH
jgi:hypothetical protein